MVLIGAPLISICLLSLVVLATCVCHRYNHHAKYLRNQFVKVILGDSNQFLRHTFSEPLVEDVNNHDETDSERHGSRRLMRRRTIAYHYITFGLGGITLIYVVVIWWYVLVEQVAVNKCVIGADCFEQANSRVTLTVTRVNDCSNYSLPDGMVLWCYKAGFYFLDACAKAGGILAIVSITFKLYFLTLISCAKGQKRCFYFAGAITGCIAMLLAVGCFLLWFLLPSNSHLLGELSGTSAVQIVPLFLVAALIPIATCLSAEVHSVSQTEYEELP